MHTTVAGMLLAHGLIDVRQHAAVERFRGVAARADMALMPGRKRRMVSRSY